MILFHFISKKRPYLIIQKLLLTSVNDELFLDKKFISQILFLLAFGNTIIFFFTDLLHHQYFRISFHFIHKLSLKNFYIVISQFIQKTPFTVEIIIMQPSSSQYFLDLDFNSFNLLFSNTIRLRNSSLYFTQTCHKNSF